MRIFKILANLRIFYDFLRIFLKTQPEECTSIQCDGINYAILASK